MISKMFYPITNNVKEENELLNFKEYKKLEKDIKFEEKNKIRYNIALENEKTKMKIIKNNNKTKIKLKKELINKYTKKNIIIKKPEISIFTKNDIINIKENLDKDIEIEKNCSIFENNLNNEENFTSKFKKIRNLIKNNNLY